MLEGLLPFSGYVRFFVTLAAVLDPFLAVPIFLALTASRSARERSRLVNAVAVTVFAVLAGAALFGEQLLVLVGASLPAFRVGGGLVLLLMALAMLNAQAGGAVHFAALLVCVLAVCMLTWITLRLAAPIGARMGTTGLNIATRLLGLLLAALAIQTMAEGLRQLFPGLA